MGIIEKKIEAKVDMEWPKVVEKIIAINKERMDVNQAIMLKESKKHEKLKS